MLIADKRAESNSLVTFFRCTNCVSEHVSSELTNDDQLISSSRLEFFEPSLTQNFKYS
jgi:hypothetical protein